MRVPIGAAAEIQQAFREVWREIDIWQSAPVIDLRSRRIGKAGASVDDDDYVTKKELSDEIATVVTVDADDPQSFQDLIIRGDLTLARFSSGSILFAGPGGRVTQDRLNLFWDDSNNRLGIGTNSPTEQISVDSYAASVTYLARRANGTRAAPTGVLSGQDIALFDFGGYHSGSAFSTAQGRIRAVAQETWTGSARGLHLDFYTTAGGSTTLTQQWRMSAAGYWMAQNLNARLGWQGRSRMLSDSDGTITLLNDAELSFTMLQFGGVTSGFPGWKRNATYLQARLADDSDWAPIAAATLNTGQGDHELYAMDQNVRTTDAVTFVTVDTGQGANELYAMDQNVRTSDNVEFADLRATGSVRFGSHTGIGAESLSGFITITDDGGTSRKLAVVS